MKRRTPIPPLSVPPQKISADLGASVRRRALQSAILNSANFTSIATDEVGVIQLFNVGAERMLGYAAADVVNKITPADISDGQELVARAEALSIELAMPIRPGFEALVFKASRGIEDIYELTYIRKDGGRFPVVVSVTALRDTSETLIGYLLLGTDNSERKRVEAQLRWSEESFRLMVDSVTDYAIIMLDPEGRVVSWNAGAQRIEGYTAEEIVGEHFSRFYLRADAASGRPQRDLAAATAWGRFEGEDPRRRKDGSSFWANVVITPILDPAGNLRGFAQVTRDLTERQKVEADLIKARAEAEKANLAKSDFLSSMSHELRTPLNAILGFAQFMESDVPPPSLAQKGSIDQILQAGWYLLKLINEILDLASIESGKVSLSLEPVLLSDVLLACKAMIEPQAQKRNIAMTFPEFHSGCFVYADGTRVQQIVINLLSNAIKYNKKDGSVAVDFTLTATNKVRVTVADTGEGLEPHELAQLFQPFNRLGRQSSGEEGSGIGLVVTRQLVELMGGSIGVESTVGTGSVFWFELSAIKAPELPHEEALTGSQSFVATKHPRLRTLLYVEDNPANLQLVEKLIGRCPNIQLSTAENGSTGVALARSLRPEVILMDIHLPGMSGVEALAILRDDPLTAHIPVIALSANATPRDIEKGLKAGFCRYLTKPIRVTEFMAALDEGFSLAAPEAPRPGT